MKISVSRSGKDTPYHVFDVPVERDDLTVMDVLDYIYENLDGTLAYYRHSRCNQGVCGRCAVKLNGKPVLACTAVIDPALDQISLSPANDRVVKDLVVAAD